MPERISTTCADCNRALFSTDADADGRCPECGAKAAAADERARKAAK